MRLSLLITCIIVLFFGGKVVAQPYPVTTVLQLTTPNLPHLDAYTISTSNPLMLSTILNDVTQTSYDVRFKLTISGEGITINTNDQFIPPTKTLFYNVPVILTGADLAEYFNPDHLDFAGINKEQYLRDGKLPEGFYTICFEAYDARLDRELAVSNRTCSQATVQEHDPSVILTPIGELDEVKPQFYYFSWQPMHVSTFPVEYELFIYEKIQGLTDDQILTVTPPIFRTTTPLTTYQYSPTDPLLKKRQDYLIQVKVKDVAESEYFKNNGESKVKTFSIIPPCVPGEICDDGLACTYDDRVGDDCACTGTPHYDENNDGACDELTLPPPLIVSPQEEDNCSASGHVVTAWEPQHHININVLYEVEVWITGIDVLQTKEYLAFIANLATELGEFSTKLGDEKNEFLAQQQIKLEDYKDEIAAINEQCLTDIQHSIKVFENDMAASAEAFEKYIRILYEKCTTEKNKALEEFNAQIKIEISDFQNIQQKEAEGFSARLDQNLANFKRKIEAQASAFDAEQEKALLNFLAQLTQQNQNLDTNHDQTVADLEQAETNLITVYQDCIKDAENYIENIRADTRLAIQALRDEIAVINFAIETLQAKYQDDIQTLRDELAEQMIGANRSEKRQLRRAFNANLTDLKSDFRATLAALKARKEEYKNQIRTLRIEQREMLQNADAAIREAKQICKIAYTNEQAKLKEKAAIAAQILADGRSQIQQDSLAFLQAQSEKRNNFEAEQAEQIRNFEAQQIEQQADFAAQQKEEQSTFAATIKKRQEVFQGNLKDCKKLVTEERALFKEQQAQIRADFEEEIANRRAGCDEESEDLLAAFLAQQAQELANFEAQQAEQIRNFEAQQAEQEAAFIADLEVQYANGQLIFSTTTDNLYYQFNSADVEFQAGYEYSIQVTATDSSGVAIFENDGESNWWPIKPVRCKPSEELLPPVALEPINSCEEG